MAGGFEFPEGKHNKRDQSYNIPVTLTFYRARARFRFAPNSEQPYYGQAIVPPQNAVACTSSHFTNRLRISPLSRGNLLHRADGFSLYKSSHSAL